MQIEVNSDDHGIIQFIQKELGYSEDKAMAFVMEFMLCQVITKGNFFKRLRFQRKLDKILDKHPTLVDGLRACWSLE